MAGPDGALAFPFLDVTNQDDVPQGTEMSNPDAQDLLHQLQLTNGLSPPAGGGWTFIPRVDIEEELTDNVLQQHSPRQADLGTFITPGIGIAGDLPRIQMTFSFAPTLAVYARTSELDALTEQMNGLASVTVVPDFAYVDVRALSGVQSQFGAVGGFGTLGASTTSSSLATIPSLGNTIGLNKNNEVQTSSFSISPYLLSHFGDWGNGKLGYSLAVTRSDSLSGFTAPPFPTGGVNGQILATNEGFAHYDTADALGALQDSIDIDLSQGQTTTDAGFAQISGVPAANATTTNSSRFTVTDRITWQLNRTVALFASGGHEDLSYSQSGFNSVHDLTWSLGTTLTPNPDTSLTVSYGHANGVNALTVDGHYALTARTILTASYGSTLGTQLQTVQEQLNLAAPGANGNLINAQTGGPLFGSSNALAQAEGVFRTTTLTLASQTTLDRDIITLSLVMSDQTSAAGISNTNATTKTASVSWRHSMRPNMTLSAAFSYVWQNQGSGYVYNSGNSTSAAVTVAWQYQISETLGATIRYSFFERRSAVSADSLYQNLLILGISKTF